MLQFFIRPLSEFLLAFRVFVCFYTQMPGERTDVCHNCERKDDRNRCKLYMFASREHVKLYATFEVKISEVWLFKKNHSCTFVVF